VSAAAPLTRLQATLAGEAELHASHREPLRQVS
jgi:hypothetical protein